MSNIHQSARKGKALYPATIARVGSAYLGNEQWALWSLNTESVVATAVDKLSLEKFADINGYKITKVLNDYN